MGFTLIEIEFMTTVRYLVLNMDDKLALDVRLICLV